MRVSSENQLTICRIMIARSIFSKLIDSIKSFFSFVCNIPTMVKNHYIKILQDFHEMRHNFKNLAKANKDLGIYHLNERHYNDAIFRFWLVDKFFNNADPAINYWLGWAYFMKQNYKKALDALANKTHENSVLLSDFIANIDTQRTIPNPIYKIYRSINATNFINKFNNDKNYDLPKDLIVKLYMEMDDNNLDHYEVLDLGSNIGMLGYEIRKKLHDNLTIRGVEISQKMIELQGKEYDEVINKPIDEFLDASQKNKYNIIVSLDGFATNANLDKTFNNIYQTLSPHGYFAFAIKENKDNKIEPKHLEFSYKWDYINNTLQQTGFEILNWVQIELAIKNNYFIFICKKP